MEDTDEIEDPVAPRATHAPLKRLEARLPADFVDKFERAIPRTSRKAAFLQLTVERGLNYVADVGLLLDVFNELFVTAPDAMRAVLATDPNRKTLIREINQRLSEK